MATGGQRGSCPPVLCSEREQIRDGSESMAKATAKVPVVPGKQGQYDLKSGTTTDPCAACGDKDGTQRFEKAGGVYMMLCIDFTRCVRTYRGGLLPVMYAELLRKGERP
jgi:hypothetical protein